MMTSSAVIRWLAYKTNVLYQENDAKRTRAMKKAGEEKDLKKLKEKEILK